MRCVFAALGPLAVGASAAARWAPSEGMVVFHRALLGRLVSFFAGALVGCPIEALFFFLRFSWLKTFGEPLRGPVYMQVHDPVILVQSKF